MGLFISGLSLGGTILYGFVKKWPPLPKWPDDDFPIGNCMKLPCLGYISYFWRAVVWILPGKTLVNRLGYVGSRGPIFLSDQEG